MEVQYAQEQGFFCQTTLVSKKEEKIEMMTAVSFMYVQPPSYDAESAKAAKIADEMKKEGQTNPARDLPVNVASSSKESEQNDRPVQERRNPGQGMDVFGRPSPTEEEFEVLKGAPRLETGVPARSKPFGVEVRNVRCAQCGNFGHQSGDHECPLKNVILPNKETIP